MVPVRHLIDYISKKYRGSKYLSIEMLSHILFLVDWYYTIKTGEPLSDAEWVLTQSGPVANGLEELISESKELAVVNIMNYYGEYSPYILVQPWYGGFYSGPLKREVRLFVDKVLADIAHSNPNEFVDKVESSYPILTSNFDEAMNLPLLRDGYRQWLKVNTRQNSTGSFTNLPAVKS